MFNEKGLLVDLEKTQLQELYKQLLKIHEEHQEYGQYKKLQEMGGYGKGCCFILADFSETIMFLKPKNGKKHEYFIPSLQTSHLHNLSFAICAFLRQEGKNRTKLVIADERTGKQEFLVEDSIHTVGRKICKILICNLKV